MEILNHHHLGDVKFERCQLSAVDWDAIRAPAVVQIVDIVDSEYPPSFPDWIARQPSITGVTIRGATSERALLQSKALQAKLKSLGIEHRPISDDIILEILLFRSLVVIDMEETDLTDDQAMHLLDLPKLHIMNLMNTRVTSQGIHEIISKERGMSILPDE